MVEIKELFCNSAKNTAHNERRLLNFPYLCNVKLGNYGRKTISTE